MGITRRQFLKAGILTGAGLAMSCNFRLTKPEPGPLVPGLSDPVLQPKFAYSAPNALDPSFKYVGKRINGRIKYEITTNQTEQMTGLVDANGKQLATPVWGYGPLDKGGVSWPGMTFEAQSGEVVEIEWKNDLPNRHLLPVDTNLHWCYSLKGMSSVNGVDYSQFSIEKHGVPIVTHLHGGHSDSPFDGNPEYFYGPRYSVRGPRWVHKNYIYRNDQPAGNLWYHDHALGITRLNVYAGLAGFYFIRDSIDTGKPDNPLGLPAFPYELAYAVQDRMFKNTGELFYPAYPGDPFYHDFIIDEGADLPADLFPNGGPTALAEFFGDHMVVNGVIWPRANVEPRRYRIHLLNGCDSRFMVIRFRIAAQLNATGFEGASNPIPFYVIGSDQGLASATTKTDTLVFEPGSRYDIIFDFSKIPAGSRVILENIGYDEPFGGEFGFESDYDDEVFPSKQTNRIMAFDVTLPVNKKIPDLFDPEAIGQYEGNKAQAGKIRKVALFEGKDEFGRLQPLLGANDGADWKGATWHSPTTETPELNSTEEWAIYNFTEDAHPVHLHLVNFEILGRNRIEFDSDEGKPGRSIEQHNGKFGKYPKITNVKEGEKIFLKPEDGYVENAPKDMVTALPEQVTRIKATFDKPGRYVWHCHILSHEDHEMMRVLHIG